MISTELMDAPRFTGQKMNTPTAQELLKAVKYGQKKNARICEFLSEMLGYTYPALPRTVVKVQQDKNKTTREKLCQSIVRLPQEVKQQDFVRVGLMSLFLVEEYRFNKVLFNITQEYRQFLDTCTEYRVAVKNFSASWIYQDFPSFLRRSRSSWFLPATDLCDLIVTRYNIQYVESKYRLVIAARLELGKLDAQVQDYLPDSSIKSWRELIHCWSELIEYSTSEPELSVAEPELSVAEPELSVAEPESSIAEPELSVAEPELSVAEPETSVAEPESSVAEPELSVAEPESSVAEPPLLANRLQSNLADGLSTSKQAVCTVETTGESQHQCPDQSQQPEYDSDQIHGGFEAEQEVDVLTVGQSQDTEAFQPDAQATSPHGEAHQEGVTTVAEETGNDHAQTQPKQDTYLSPDHTTIGAEPINKAFVAEANNSIYNPGTDAEECSWKGPMETLQREWFRMNATMTTEEEDEIVRQENQRQYYWADTVEENDTHAKKMCIAIEKEHHILSSHVTMATSVIDDEAADAEVDMILNGGHASHSYPCTEDTDVEMFSKGNQHGIPGQVQQRDTQHSSDQTNIGAEPINKVFVAEINTSFNNPDTDVEKCSWKGPMESLQRDWFRMNATMTTEDEDEIVRQENKRKYYWADTVEENDAPDKKMCLAMDIEHHTYQAAFPSEVPTYIDGASRHCTQYYQGPGQFTAESPLHSGIVRVPARRAVELPSPHSSTPLRSCLPPKHRLRYHPYIAGSAFKKVSARHSADLC